MYNVYVEDFMVRDVKYIWHGISYQRLKEILKENRKLRGFPLVDNPDSMILLGSIQRLELIKLIEKHIGRERRLQVLSPTLLYSSIANFLPYRCYRLSNFLSGGTKVAQGGRGEGAGGNGTTIEGSGEDEATVQVRSDPCSGYS